ncbi:MAG: hypothetical protein QOJ84_1115 [Bradyrhizobium sp.]|nr:hypothetical protein [Bradyrhizobium sp.]
MVMAWALAANTGGYSGETTSPTIKSIRNRKDMFFTFDFWHTLPMQSKSLHDIPDHDSARHAPGKY